MSETLGKVHFWLSFVCINFIFMPMFFQGMAGVSRRLYDAHRLRARPRRAGAQRGHLLGAWGLGLFQLLFIVNFFMSLKTGARVAENPWNATTLEWAAPSPPGHGNFLTEPVVYRGPYEYSVPGQADDFSPQFVEGAPALRAHPQGTV